MPCYYPLKGFRSRLPTKNGKFGIVFSAKDGYVDRPVEVACGQCIGCRLARSRQWAIRCVHEASLYDRNCFITLTYSDEHLPKSMSLDAQAFPRFMKRLRKFVGQGPRYFHCGEYGERFGRPHYHACIFNYDFPDKVHYRNNDRGDKCYRSDFLERLWPFGRSEIGEVTFESAAYVARYCVKKVTGEDAENHYTYIDPETGEFYQRLPEYVTMSRRPGIGAPWLERYLSDVYPDDFVVVRGVKMKPPKYYDKLFFDGFSHYELDDYKRERGVKALRRKDDNTPERLKVREKVQLARISSLKRSVE